MEWLEDPNQSNLGNLRRAASRNFRNKEREYLKAKIDELQTNSTIKNIRDTYRGINDFKKGYQPKSNIAKDEKSDMVTDFHRILARWRTHFSQLFNVHGVSDVRQTETHTAEPLVPQPRASKVEMATEKLKRHELPDIDQIPAGMIKVGGKTIPSEIHKLINSIWNTEGDNTDCSNYRGISILSTMYKIVFNMLL